MFQVQLQKGAIRETLGRVMSIPSRDKVLRYFRLIDLVIENLKALTLKLFELASLIYVLYKIVLHR